MGKYLNKRWIDYVIVVLNGMFWGYPYFITLINLFLGYGVHVYRFLDVIFSIIVFCMIISLIVCVIGFKYGATGRDWTMYNNSTSAHRRVLQYL